MGRTTQIRGKRPPLASKGVNGRNVARRNGQPKIQTKRFWVESEGKWVTMKVTAKAQRVIEKKGIDATLASVRSSKHKT